MCGFQMRARLCVLTVGCGRVSVSVVPPQEHVEGQVGDVVTLIMDDTTENRVTEGGEEVRYTGAMVTQL